MNRRKLIKRGLASLNNAIVYVRADNSNAIAKQLALCWKYCDEHDLKIVNGFAAHGSSVDEHNELELRRMMRYCHTTKKPIAALVTMSPDRLTRSMPKFVAVRNELAKLGIVVLSVDAEKQDPTQVFMDYLSDAIATFERETRSRRIKVCIAAKRLREPRSRND